MKFGEPTMPTPADFQKANEAMTEEQEKMSKEREETLNEGKRQGRSQAIGVIKEMDRNSLERADRWAYDNRLDDAAYKARRIDEANQMALEFDLSDNAKSMLKREFAYSKKMGSVRSFVNYRNYDEVQTAIELIEKLPNIEVFDFQETAVMWDKKITMKGVEEILVKLFERFPNVKIVNGEKEISNEKILKAIKK